jgi:hypothetical protein
VPTRAIGDVPRYLFAPAAHATAMIQTNHVEAMTLRHERTGSNFMAHVHPQTRLRDHDTRDLLAARDLVDKDSEIGALRNENSELRKLVIELSRLVIKKVVEQQH